VTGQRQRFAPQRQRLARLPAVRCGSRPRPHGEQPRERAVGPIELFYDLAVVVLVAQAGSPPGSASDLARDRRVRRGVHAGVDRLGQRHPAPRTARSRGRQGPAARSLPADPGARRHGRLHPAGRRRARRRVRHRGGRPVRGAGRPLAARRTGRPAGVPPEQPAVRRWDGHLRGPAGRHRPPAGQCPGCRPGA